MNLQTVLKKKAYRKGVARLIQVHRFDWADLKAFLKRYGYSLKRN